MDDVGGGVGLASSKTGGRVDLPGHLVTDSEVSVETYLVDDEAGNRALDVQDLEIEAIGADDAGVGVLATHLGIERGLGEHDLDD